MLFLLLLFSDIKSSLFLLSVFPASVSYFYLESRIFSSVGDTSLPEASLVGFKTLSQIRKDDQEVLPNIFIPEESGVFSQNATAESLATV